jgi:chromosome partitioning protein
MWSAAKLSEKIEAFLNSLTQAELVVGAVGAAAAAASGAWAVYKLANAAGKRSGKAEQDNFLRYQAEEAKKESDKLKDRLEKTLEELRIAKENAAAVGRGSGTAPSPSDEALLEIRAKVASGKAQLWDLRPAQVPLHIGARIRAGNCKILTIANLKGGVGKTTLTVNLAGYFSQNRKKRVLIVDLDFQGSASGVLLKAAKREVYGDRSLADALISGHLSGLDVVERSVDLGPVLQAVRLVEAGATLQNTEDSLLLRWLLGTTEHDVRFHLAETLLSDEVQKRFDLIIIDVGPRLTTASISALCASTHLLIPTNLDRLSAETVVQFVSQLTRLKRDLGLPIELAGVVGTMTYQDTTTDAEKDALGLVREGFTTLGVQGYVFNRNVPRKKLLADLAGSHIGYLRSELRTLFDQLGTEVANRIGLK